jgi:glycerol-3-phosphate acyltransferase PlsX
MGRNKDRPITIALDAMGGDHGPEVVVPAAAEKCRQRTDHHLILVGREEELRTRMDALAPSGLENLSIANASQVVEMTDAPSQALRLKKDSSMRVAIDLVKSGAADACVSAGNTGALMATARFLLRTLPGIDRPAICTSIPSRRGHTHVLDLGANVDSKAEHLLQFAVMGSELAKAVNDLASPSVGLLNIGEEEIKGNDQVKEAAALISNSDIRYVGYVEGDDIYMGDVDVVVCDGFVGNVALKSSEGVARMIRTMIREEFTRSPISKLIGLMALPVLKRLRRRIDPRRYNGASLLGLRGIVIKSHGGADSLAFTHAIEIASLEVEKDVPNRIRSHLETLLDQRQAM